MSNHADIITCTVDDGLPVKVLGTTADFEGCECCGRTNLRTYVVIEHESGAARHYGTGCAATLMDYDTASMRDIAKQAEARRNPTPEMVKRAAARRAEQEQRARYMERLDRGR